MTVRLHERLRICVTLNCLTADIAITILSDNMVAYFKYLIETLIA